MAYRECVKDRKFKYSIFLIPSKAPYPLNVYDRDFLVIALNIFKAR